MTTNTISYSLLAGTNSSNLEEKSRSIDDEYEVHGALDHDQAHSYMIDSQQIEYGYKTCPHIIPQEQEQRSKFIALFDAKEPAQYREGVIGYCNETKQSHQVIKEFCDTAKQLKDFERLQSVLSRT
eukprot:332686_1